MGEISLYEALGLGTGRLKQDFSHYSDYVEKESVRLTGSKAG